MQLLACVNKLYIYKTATKCENETDVKKKEKKRKMKSALS